MKKLVYILCAMVIVTLVAIRVSAIGTEKHQYVFNAARIAADSGVAVETMVAKTTDGILNAPIHINSNRGYVAYARLGKFAPGQKVGGGEIISVSNQIDLDTGMYIVRTKNVKNGFHMAQTVVRGIYVPLYAINNGVVMVVSDGIAVSRDITIQNSDDEFAVVDGITDGDIIILSHINNGDKLRVK